jgi:uncharacterized alkaline shock family protein YloU
MTQAEAMEPGQAAPQPARTPATGASTLVTEQGRTTIANGVVAQIAGMAAREITGVQQLVTASAGAPFGGLARAVMGSEVRDPGVRVEVGEREAAVDLRMIVAYGASIPQVAQAVRHNIIARVREMTGLSVREVNIEVVDLAFGEERAAQPQAQPLPPRRVE